MAQESMEESADTIELDVAKLYAVWENMQKDTVHKPNKWEEKLQLGEAGRPIIVTMGDQGVRVPDGRHRLAGHFAVGRATILAMATEHAKQIKEIYDL